MWAGSLTRPAFAIEDGHGIFSDIGPSKPHELLDALASCQQVHSLTVLSKAPTLR